MMVGGGRLPRACTRGVAAASSARTPEEWRPLWWPLRLRRPERVCFPHGGSSFYPHKSGGDYGDERRQARVVGGYLRGPLLGMQRLQIWSTAVG
jgi:hypothetical protein